MTNELAFHAKMLAKAFFMPPGLFVLVLLVVSWVILKKSSHLRGSVFVLLTLAVMLYSMSISAVVEPLSAALENRYKPLPWRGDKPDIQSIQAQAIVVLAGGVRQRAPEYADQDEPSWRSLERLRYGAQLARAMNLPILVTGGTSPGTVGSEAGAMRRVLAQDFGIQARWVEDQSLDTADNARLSARLLKADGVTTIYLVTHATHMGRAVALFERQGLKVIPAPMGFLGVSRGWLERFVPQVAVLQRFYDTLHEWIGTAWMQYGQNN
jgi:uncharacterized SAM-binding protein YcdF (DUF218 family)